MTRCYIWDRPEELEECMKRALDLVKSIQDRSFTADKAKMEGIRSCVRYLDKIVEDLMDGRERLFREKGTSSTSEDESSMTETE